MDSVLFLDNLKRLHRKEQQSLAAYALADTGLGTAFKAEVKSKMSVVIPDEAFVAFDYQLSSIYAASVLTSSDRRGPHPAGGGIDRGHQESIDMLIAWQVEEIVEIVLVEAEGVSGWSGKNLLSKAHWLGDIFGYEAASHLAGTHPRFALAAPSAPPADLITLEWPEWMLGPEGVPLWLKMPVANNLLKVTRTTQDGMPRGSGGFWIVEKG